MSELQGLQSHIGEIREAGGEVVAISSDAVEQNQRLNRRLKLEFPLLADPDLKVIDAYGLRHVHGGMSGDVARPATLVLDGEGTIRETFFTENWRVRPAPGHLVEVLQSMP